MSARPARLAGVETFVSRSGYTGEDGYEISLGSAQAESFARTLLSQPDVAPIGLGARDSLRLEAGLCLYGHELDETVDPIEAALTWSIQKRRRVEGGFPGAERIQTRAGEWAGSSARRRSAGRTRAGARGNGDCLGGWRADRRCHVGRVRAKRQRADRDGLRRARPRRGRNADQSHGARQALERARCHAAFSSPRLLSRLSKETHDAGDPLQQGPRIHPRRGRRRRRRHQRLRAAATRRRCLCRDAAGRQGAEEGRSGRRGRERQGGERRVRAGFGRSHRRQFRGRVDAGPHQRGRARAGLALSHQAR